MSQKININQKVLKWARKTAHLQLCDIPKSLISQDKLQKIENGKAAPTFVQLQKLAKKYDRPLSVLMGQNIPDEDFIEIPFFRKENKIAYNSSLTLFIRDIQKKQEWVQNYLIDEGFVELDFIGSMDLNHSFKIVASKIVDRLNLPNFEIFNYAKRIEYFKSIKKSLEENNIFVSVTGSHKNKAIDLEDAQGFALSDNFAPFIFVNTRSTINAKIFTILHEVVHLFLNETGISEEVIKFRKAECREDEIENFCNKVVAEILIPEKTFFNFYKNLSGSLFKKIEKCSKKFLVSELAICIRLFHLELIDFDTFNSTFNEIKTQIAQYLKDKSKKQKEKSGGDYYASMRSKNGLLLSKFAFYAYQEGQILATDISKLLSVKVNNFNKYFEAI